MKCELCGVESEELVNGESDGRPRRICPSCLNKEQASTPEDCRCKESIGKTPKELGRMILDDLKFWKK